MRFCVTKKAEQLGTLGFGINKCPLTINPNHKPETVYDYWVLGSARVAGLGSRLE